MIDDVLVPTAPAVSFRAVRMSFDAEPVLEGIDLELRYRRENRSRTRTRLAILQPCAVLRHVIR